MKKKAPSSKYDWKEVTQPITDEQPSESVTTPENIPKIDTSKMNVSEMNTIREKLCTEFVRSEETYCQNLLEYTGHFSQPLHQISKENPYILTEANYSRYFGGLTAFRNLSEKLSQDLKHLMFAFPEEYVGFHHGCEVGKKLRIMIPFFRLYQSYASRWATQTGVIDKLLISNKELSKKVKEIENSGNLKEKISWYRYLPIRRILEIGDLANKILSVTGKSHVDHEYMKKAVTIIDKCVNSVRDTLRGYEQQNEVKEIEKQFANIDKFGFPIFQPSRRFFRVFVVLDVKNKEVHLHLFSDVVVVSTKTENNLFQMLATNLLPEVTVEVTENDNLMFRMNSSVYKTKNTREKNELLSIIIRNKLAKLKENEEHEKKEVDKFNISLDECLDYVKNRKSPTKMLMYRKSRFLHWNRPAIRKFVVSQDENKLMWWDKDICSIEFRNVLEVCLGQTTKPFLKNPKPAAESLSFSLLYAPGRFDHKTNMWSGGSVDLICCTKREFHIWTTALKFLITQPFKKFQRRQMRKEEKQNAILREKYAPKVKVKYHNRVYVFNPFSGTNEKISILSKLFRFDVKSFCSRYAKGCCVTNGGDVLVSGENEFSQLGFSEERVKVIKQMTKIERGKSTSFIDAKLGIGITLLLDSNGTVYLSGKLGERVFSKSRVLVPVYSKVILIDCADHCGLVCEQGKIMTFGVGDCGQLGHGNDVKFLQDPQIIESLSDVRTIQISFQKEFSSSLSENGEVFIWGKNTISSLTGRKSYFIPIKVPQLLEVRQISSSSDVFGVVYSSGELHLFVGEKLYSVTKIFGPKSRGSDDLAEMKNNKFRVVNVSCKPSSCMAFIVTSISGPHVYSWEYGSKIYPIDKFNDLPYENIQSIDCGDGNAFIIKENFHSFVKDKFFENSSGCMDCGRCFTAIRRRHHCRNCGGLFCKKCTYRRIQLVHIQPEWVTSRFRVCNWCYKRITEDTEEASTVIVFVKDFYDCVIRTKK